VAKIPARIAIKIPNVTASLVMSAESIDVKPESEFKPEFSFVENTKLTADEQKWIK